MWSHPNIKNVAWRRVGLTVALLAGLTVLGGCGFKPLYGTDDDGGGVATELSYVAIPEQRQRLGQLVRNKLLSTMSPPGGPVAEKYILEFTSTSNANDLVIESNTDISRRLYKLSVEYRLISKTSNKVVHRGKTFSHVAYDRVSSEFSNIQAESNVRERAAHQVADDIRTRLAAYFSSY